MRQLFYSVIVLVLNLQNLAFGQNTQVIKETIELENINLLELELTDLPISILPSLDNKIHIDFKFNYKGLSKQTINEKLAQIKFNKQRVNNNMILSFKSTNEISSAIYMAKSFNVEDIAIQKTLMGKQKTKNEIIKAIMTSELASEMFLPQFRKRIQEDATSKMIEAQFILYVPSHLRLKINAENARVSLEIQNPNSLELRIDRASFKGKNLTNANVSIKNASFKVENFNNGTLSLDKASRSLIGGIKNATINASFSKVEIGEIQENITITDFNSEYYFYNFSDDFKKFKLIGEYTNFHFYHPKDDFSMTAIGHNTVNHFDNVTISMQPNKTGKKFKMMTRRKNGEGTYAGHIDFDIIHGIIHSHNNTFKPNKNN